jgi:hypothetical protein
VCTCSDSKSLVLWELANTQIHMYRFARARGDAGAGAGGAGRYAGGLIVLFSFPCTVVDQEWTSFALTLVSR